VEINNQGGFAKVLTVRGKILDEETGKMKKEIVAIKKISEKSEHHVKNNNCEVACLLELNHENVIRIKSAYRLSHELWIVMEHMQGGTLSELLKMRTLTEPQILYISQQILMGLEYIHSKNIVHR